MFLIILLYLIPTPYYLNAPGLVTSCDSIVKIKDPGGLYSLKHFSKKFKGKFYLTTVYYTRANLLLYLHALLSPDAELTKPEKGEGLNYKYYDDFMNCEMGKSKSMAKVAALTEAGYSVELENYGAEIMAVDKISKALGILRPGDIILEVNKGKIKNIKQLNEIIRSYKDGQKVLLSVKRRNDIKIFNVELIKFNKLTAIGVYVSDAFRIKKMPLDIEINTSYINGSSAGLMFALEILRKIFGKDIAFGEKVAGTGIINAGGEIGEVTGIKFKLKAAGHKGARFFLVPYGNFAEAASYSLGMVIVPVKDLKSAVKKLSEIHNSKLYNF